MIVARLPHQAAAAAAAVAAVKRNLSGRDATQMCHTNNTPRPATRSDVRNTNPAAQNSAKFSNAKQQRCW
jgi:hypothetical protein